MFKRQTKDEPEQGRGRRVQRSGGGNPAFSYYTNRTSEAQPRRSQTRQEASAESTGKGRRLPRSFSQLPFWLLIALAVVCALKILTLSTTPKVVVLGKTAVTGTYLKPTATYAAAAHQQLATSITSRSKLTVNLDGTAAALEHEFPELQAVSLTMPLVGSRPIVYVQVAQPSLILQTTHGNYALNKKGLVLAKVSIIPSGVPLVVDQSGAQPYPGKQYLPSSTVGFAKTIAYQFGAAKLAISAYVLPAGSPYELDVRLDGQPYLIRYNLQADALTQSGAAIATIQQLGGTTPAAYIDVRTPDRVFYK